MHEKESTKTRLTGKKVKFRVNCSKLEEFLKRILIITSVIVHFVIMVE